MRELWGDLFAVALFPVRLLIWTVCDFMRRRG